MLSARIPLTHLLTCLNLVCLLPTNWSVCLSKSYLLARYKLDSHTLCDTYRQLRPDWRAVVFSPRWPAAVSTELQYRDGGTLTHSTRPCLRPHQRENHAVDKHIPCYISLYSYGKYIFCSSLTSR